MFGQLRASRSICSLRLGSRQTFAAAASASPTEPPQAQRRTKVLPRGYNQQKHWEREIRRMGNEGNWRDAWRFGNDKHKQAKHGKGPPVTPGMYTAALDALALSGRWLEAETLIAAMPSVRNVDEMALMRAYLHQRKGDQAMRVMEESLKNNDRGEVSREIASLALEGLAQQGDWVKAWSVLLIMRERKLAPTRRAHKALQVEMSSQGLDPPEGKGDPITNPHTAAQLVTLGATQLRNGKSLKDARNQWDRQLRQPGQKKSAA
ncbi:unnamed protein product [Chrysoparadoxa australica]